VLRHRWKTVENGTGGKWWKAVVELGGPRVM